MIPTSLRVVVADDSGPDTPDGDSVDNDFVQSLQDAVDSSVNNPIPISVTGTQNNYAPTGFDATAGHCTFPWSGSADVTISGFAVGSPGQRITYNNKTSAKVMYFPHASGSSASGKKFSNFATSGPTPVAPGGSATWEYDTSSGTGVWNMIAHEQGAYITPTFSAGNYTGSGSMTWTVGSGDVQTQAWKLSGRSLKVSFYITTTTVGGTPSTSLKMNNALWGNFTAAKAMFNPIRYNDNGGSAATGVAQVDVASATSLEVVTATAANWSAATDATAVFGQIEFEVT